MTMTRRTVLQLIAGASVVGGVTREEAADRSTTGFGLLTVDGWYKHKGLTGESLHVRVNGVDVTRDCYEAHDRDGYALVYCRDTAHHPRGDKHIDPEDPFIPCRVRLTGHVVIVPGDLL